MLYSYVIPLLVHIAPKGDSDRILPADQCRNARADLILSADRARELSEKGLCVIDDVFTPEEVRIPIFQYPVYPVILRTYETLQWRLSFQIAEPNQVTSQLHFFMDRYRRSQIGA